MSFVCAIMPRAVVLSFAGVEGATRCCILQSTGLTQAREQVCGWEVEMVVLAV